MEELQLEHTSGQWGFSLIHAMLCYEEKQWNICADLKVTTMLTGLHGRYTKFCCL